MAIELLAPGGSVSFAKYRNNSSVTSGRAVDNVMAWCQNSRVPAILAQANSNVVWSNNAGSALLAERDHFSLRADKLTCMESSQGILFHAFVEKKMLDLSSWISQRDSSIMIVLREEMPCNELRGLSFLHVGAAVDYLWADFGPVLSLTAAEVRVSQRLIEGAGAEGIARSLGVGVETIRTHVRRVYNKLGISSREELFARLSPYRLR